MSVTFRVSDVAVGEPDKSAKLDVSSRIKKALNIDVEAWGTNHGSDLLAGAQWMNGFLRAIHTAFAGHYPLVLSPDDVWTAVAQGFAAHVNANADTLRRRFVAHEGRALIEIEPPNFEKGSPRNDWMGAFSELSERIAEHIGTKRDLLVGAFSTTGPIAKAASEIALMDAMKAYFVFGVKTLCGIPTITLLGTPDDWKQIRRRARVLSEFDCAVWVESLVEVLDEFVAASEGRQDREFWESLYKIGGGSGGPYVTGAVNVFYPYLADSRRNAAAVSWRDRASSSKAAPTAERLPSGICSVPFTWTCRGSAHPMRFLGGFMGATQDATTLAVRPVLGWAVGNDPCTVPRDGAETSATDSSPPDAGSDPWSSDDEQGESNSVVVELGARDRNEHRNIKWVDGVLTVGRAQTNGLCLPARNVSKRHARISLEAGRYFVTDLNSTNGTYVNRVRVHGPVRLSAGDRVYVGDYVLIIKL